MLTNFRKFSIAALAITAVATGCGGGGKDNAQFEASTGLKAPSVDITDTGVVITQIIPHVALEGGASYPIPHMPNSLMTIGPDLLSDGLLIQASLDARDLLALTGGGVVIDPKALPDGRALPISGGILPGLAVTIPQFFDISLYAGSKQGQKVFALFVPVKMPWDEAILTYAFKKSGKRLGQLSAVGKHNGGGSGVFLAINIGAAEQKTLENLAKAH